MSAPPKFSLSRRNTYAERNSRLRCLGFRSYQKYLVSPLWRGIKKLVRAAKGDECFCGRPATEYHHSRYLLCDLDGSCTDFIWPICSAHHREIEFDERGNKRTAAEAGERFEELKSRA